MTTERYEQQERRDPRIAANRLRGMKMDDPDASAILDAADWTDCWPEIDRDGEYTGNVIGNEDGYWNVGDSAMISHDEANAGGWKHSRSEGTAWLE